MRQQRVVTGLTALEVAYEVVRDLEKKRKAAYQGVKAAQAGVRRARDKHTVAVKEHREAKEQVRRLKQQGQARCTAASRWGDRCRKDYAKKFHRHRVGPETWDDDTIWVKEQP